MRKKTKRSTTVKVVHTEHRRMTLAFFERERDDVQQIAMMLAEKKQVAVNNIERQIKALMLVKSNIVETTA